MEKRPLQSCFVVEEYVQQPCKETCTNGFRKVFKILWAEPGGQIESKRTTFDGIEENRDSVYMPVRRFVSIREHGGWLICM
jgi:hypothetical protein